MFYIYVKFLYDIYKLIYVFFLNLLLRYYCDNIKITLNFISFFHASISTLMSLYIILNNHSESLIPFINFSRNFSIGYFTYDSLMTFKYSKGIYKIGYLYHHFATIFMLTHNCFIYPIYNIIFLGELSNLPGYFKVYYKLKNEEKNLKKLYFFKNLEKVLFSIIRIFFIGYIGYENILKYGITVLSNVLIPLYFIGVYKTIEILLFDKIQKY